MATNLEVGKYKNPTKTSGKGLTSRLKRRAIFEFYVCSQ